MLISYIIPVSYTHLDVYKRQTTQNTKLFIRKNEKVLPTDFSYKLVTSTIYNLLAYNLYSISAYHTRINVTAG